MKITRKDSGVVKEVDGRKVDLYTFNHWLGVEHSVKPSKVSDEQVQQLVKQHPSVLRS